MQRPIPYRAQHHRQRSRAGSGWLVKRAAVKGSKLESVRKIAGKLGWGRKAISRLLQQVQKQWELWDRSPKGRHQGATIDLTYCFGLAAPGEGSDGMI